MRGLFSTFLFCVSIGFYGCIGIPALDYNGDGIITVIVFGDSNSEPGWQPFDNWCEKLQLIVPPDWEIICELPYAKGGAMAVGEGDLFHLPDQLTAALDAGISFDVAIFAYGTNDWLIPGTTKEAILAAYEAADVRLDDRAVFIATTPLRKDCWWCCNIHDLNMEIRDRYPATAIIDFDGGLTYTDFVDNVHMSEAGHAKRSLRAYKSLIPNS